MPALTPIPPPGRWRCRSIRRRPINSTPPITARRCSIWKRKAIATAASPIRPSRCWKSASRRWRAASGALATASGQAALYYAFANVARAGGNIVVHAAALRHHPYAAAHRAAAPGREGRFAAGDSAEALARCIDENTRAVFCETVGNPAGNICDIEAIAQCRACPWRAADRGQYGGDADAAEARRLRRRHHRAFADQVHGRPWQRHGRHCGGCAAISTGWRTPRASRNSPRRTRPITAWSMPSASAAPPLSRAPRSVYQRTTGAILSPMSAFLLLQGIETVALACRAPCRECAPRRGIPARRRRVAWVNYAGFAESPYYALAQKYLGGTSAVAADLRRQGRLSRPARISMTRWA